MYFRKHVPHVCEVDLFSHICFKSLVFFLIPRRAIKKENCNAYRMRLKRSKYCWTPQEENRDTILTIYHFNKLKMENVKIRNY